jgi:hypothetical protein
MTPYQEAKRLGLPYVKIVIAGWTPPHLGKHTVEGAVSAELANKALKLFYEILDVAAEGAS